MIYTIENFDIEAFKEFQTQVNLLKQDEKLTIFIDTNGGSVTIRDMYLDVIHSLSNVEVIGAMLISSGFSMFDMLKCPKRLLDSTFGMVHHEAWATEIGEGGVPRGKFAKFQLEYKTQEEKKKYDWMTEEEKQIYDSGEDLYLNRERLRQIFSL